MAHDHEYGRNQARDQQYQGLRGQRQACQRGQGWPQQANGHGAQQGASHQGHHALHIQCGGLVRQQGSEQVSRSETKADQAEPGAQAGLAHQG